jgi:hypothetical protein
LSVADMPRTGTGKGRFTSLEMVPITGDLRVLSESIPGADLLITTQIDCTADFSEANVAVILLDVNGYRLVDVNTALRGEFLSLKRGEPAVVTFHIRECLLKPGFYGVTLWLGRGGVEEIDSIAGVSTLHVVEDATAARHTETFPGIYQCRFSHRIAVHRDGRPQ